MSVTIKQLNDIRSLRAQARVLPLQSLEKLWEKLTVVVVERRYEEANRQTIERQRLEKLEKIWSMMLENSIDPAELLPMGVQPVKKKKTRVARPPKYQYKDESGENRTWTGQGRTPRRIAELVAEGVSLEDFEIK